MSFFHRFYSRKKTTATLAKDRLQIIISHERTQKRSHQGPEYLELLREELIKVIAQYVDVGPDAVSVNHDHARSLLELNITLPEPQAEG